MQVPAGLNGTPSTTLPAGRGATPRGGGEARPDPAPAPAANPEVSLSAAGKAAAANDAAAPGGPTGDTGRPPATAPGGLTDEELREVAQLKARDRVVRAHEQAHQAVAGSLATGGASYTTQRGPDGIDYAIGGEVPISLREGRTPEETIANARTVRAAALAPVDPSPQDRSVAAAASRLEARARAELAAAGGDGEDRASGAAAGDSPSADPGGRSVRDEAIDRARRELARAYGLPVGGGFSARG